MAGLLNAFSSGFVDGTRAGALMDATWAAQDERERMEKDRQQLEADMQEFADLSEKNSGAVMTTPEGQQVAGKVLMGNPAVRKAVNSNSGHEYAGIIKNPKAEDEYYLAVRTPEGQVRPVTVGREKGGTPVAYTQQQILNMSAASLADPAMDTPEFRQKMGLPETGTIYEAVATRFPSMGSAEQVQAAAVQGKEFIDKGGVPTAKTGVAGVKAALRNPIEEEDEEEEVGEVEQMEPGKLGATDDVYEQQVRADKKLMRSAEGRTELARRAVPLMSGGAAQDDGTGPFNQTDASRTAEDKAYERQVSADKQLMRSAEGRAELARRAVPLMSGGAAQDDGTGPFNQTTASRTAEEEAYAQQVLADKQLMRSAKGRKELARRAVALMSGGAAQDDGTGYFNREAPAPVENLPEPEPDTATADQAPAEATSGRFGSVGDIVNSMVSARDERAAKNEAERQALIAKQKEDGTYGARGVGKISRDLFDATKENVGTNVVRPLSKAASSVVAMAKNAFNTGAEVVEGFTGADEGAYQLKDEPEQAAPAPAPASKPPAPAPASKPRDAAEIAVEKKRIPAKVFSNATHVEKIDKTLGQQVAKEPLQQRVSNDQEALDRLSNLAAGRKPNSRELFLAMRLVKSGLLTPDQLGKFRETGKLDNVEFENAYKEQAARQGWTQLDLAKDRLTFDKYREQMDQQRHMQSQSLQRLKLFAEQSGKNAAAAEKQATKVYKGVHDVITADFMGRMNQMPEFKDASSGDVKFYAEAAATRLINNPKYVQSILGRDLADIGDAEHLRAGIKEIMPVIRGEGFWSKGSNIPLDTDFKKDPNKVLKGE